MAKEYIYYTRRGVFEVDEPKNVQISELHREDGPALIRNRKGLYEFNTFLNKEILDGCDLYWYQDGKLHNLDGPAYTLLDVCQPSAHPKQAYYQNGNRIPFAEGEALAAQRHLERYNRARGIEATQ